jgi:poly(3-hydroxybutyrate) depolymerase
MAPTGGSKATAGASATGGNSSAGGASGTMGCGMTNYPAPCSTSGSPCSIDVTVNGTTTTRQYYVKLPSNYNASQAYPVVFEFHYLGGSAEGIFNDNMYNVRPNFANAIYVIPQGLAGSDGNRGWPNTNNQDIDFTQAMVSTIESSYCVDQSRIFSMGFSYGGMMSITIGCLLPNVFRAIGVESGFSIVYNCNPSHEIAVWQTQGDQDTTVTPANAEAARDIFVKLNHCSSTTQAVNPSPCVAYDNCDTGYPVTWCLISGESHAMWNQAGPAIATFFKQF